MPTLPHGVRIAGLGSYLPGRVLTNEDLSRMVDTTDEWIATRTGIRERHIVSEGEKTVDLAIESALAAMDDAGVQGSEIDLVIVATSTSEMPFPSVAAQVQNAIGAPAAGAFDLAAACSGWAYALVMAAGLLGPGGLRKALVIGAETMSTITDWTDRTTCILFADGAGAAVLEPCPKGEGLLAFELGADGSGASLLSVPPPNHKIQQNGREVFRFAVTTIGESMGRVTAMAGMTPSELDWLVPHQANNRIFEAAAKRLELPQDRVYSNLVRTGNTSAASIPIALRQMRDEGLLKAGQRVGIIGFGGGLTWATALFQW